MCERPKGEIEPGAFGGSGVDRRARGEVAGYRRQAIGLRPCPEGTREPQHVTHESDLNFKRFFWLSVGDGLEYETGSLSSSSTDPTSSSGGPILASSFLNPHSAHREILWFYL